MKTFIRRNHTRTNSNGTTFNVSRHLVNQSTTSGAHNSISRKSQPPGFLVPNAECPVCHAHVFYYQNEAGSRVFFDTAWPNWDKHPCTDNGDASINIFKKSPAVDHKYIPGTIENNELRTGKVSHIYKNGGNYHIVADVVINKIGDVLMLQCKSQEIGLNQGDLIFVLDHRMSFIDKLTLKPTILRVAEFKTTNEFFRSLGFKTNLEEQQAIKRQALWPFPK
jgi:hypothetical protein